jgi:mannonate dehydratase
MSWNYQFIARVPEGFSDEDVIFLRQLNVPNAYICLGRDEHNFKRIKEIKDKITDGGIGFTTVQSNLYTFNADIILGTENRNSAIQGYIELLEILGELGIDGIEQNLMPFFVYSTNKETLNERCVIVREVDTDKIVTSTTAPLAKPAWINDDLENAGSFLERQFQKAKERGYAKEELWDNFGIFMEQVIPVAEKTGVKISLHPSDPPIDAAIGGVPQLICGLADYKKAFEIAKSDNLVMTFCCGCWIEGGNAMGNLLEDLEWSLQQKKVRMLHLRNVSAPMPRFRETFMDDGYYDLYKIFRLLRKYNYEGFINPDHHPIMVDGPKRRAPQGYAYGFMRAYAMCADKEFSDGH